MCMSRLLAFPAGRRAKWVVFARLARRDPRHRAPRTCPAKFSDAEKNESTSFLPGDAESTKALAVTKQTAGRRAAPRRSSSTAAPAA